MSTPSRNIKYRTDAIARYFASHRRSWDQFYPSERWVLERLATGPGIRRVLDIGCAAGGLGLALEERVALERYVGVELNPQAIEVARARQSAYRAPSEFYVGDILEMGELPGGPFDLVANLSCSDWNIETTAITESCWRHVCPGGALLISLRLTDGASMNDFNTSYQFIRYDGELVGDEEKANYVVFNVYDALSMFSSLSPCAASVLGYGYWGVPSRTAVTPYKRLVFAVFAITKSSAASETMTELRLPLSLLYTNSRSRG